MEERFWSKVDKSGDCWVWTGGRHKAGYGMFWNNGKMDTAHRISYILHHGDIPEGMVVRHKCANRCVNPDHLEIGTYSDNMADMVRDGTKVFGERQGGSKLTNEQVRDIRTRTNQLHREIAEEFGVSRTTISDIIRGRRWALLD